MLFSHSYYLSLAWGTSSIKQQRTVELQCSTCEFFILFLTSYWLAKIWTHLLLHLYYFQPTHLWSLLNIILFFKKIKTAFVNQLNFLLVFQQDFFPVLPRPLLFTWKLKGDIHRFDIKLPNFHLSIHRFILSLFWRFRFLFVFLKISKFSLALSPEGARGVKLEEFTIVLFLFLNFV